MISDIKKKTDWKEVQKIVKNAYDELLGEYSSSIIFIRIKAVLQTYYNRWFDSLLIGQDITSLQHGGLEYAAQLDAVEKSINGWTDTLCQTVESSGSEIEQSMVKFIGSTAKRNRNSASLQRLFAVLDLTEPRVAGVGASAASSGSSSAAAAAGAGAGSIVSLSSTPSAGV